jgi:hypothetical protein
VWRGRFQRARDDVHEDLVRHFARDTRPRFVRQAFETTDAKPFAPFTDTIARDVQRAGDRPIGLTGRAREYDASAQSQPLRRL